MRIIVRKIFISKTKSKTSMFAQAKQGRARYEYTTTFRYEEEKKRIRSVDDKKKTCLNYHLFSLCLLTNRKSMTIDVAISRINSNAMHVVFLFLACHIHRHAH